MNTMLRNRERRRGYTFPDSPGLDWIDVPIKHPQLWYLERERSSREREREIIRREREGGEKFSLGNECPEFFIRVVTGVAHVSFLESEQSWNIASDVRETEMNIAT
jgi:hypothetical protein